MYLERVAITNKKGGKERESCGGKMDSIVAMKKD